MKDNHQAGVSHQADFERITMKSATGFALTVTLISLLVIKMMTGITGFGAFGIALLAFCLSFSFALRAGRGVHR